MTNFVVVGNSFIDREWQFKHAEDTRLPHLPAGRTATKLNRRSNGPICPNQTIIVEARAGVVNVIGVTGIVIVTYVPAEATSGEGGWSVRESCMCAALQMCLSVCLCGCVKRCLESYLEWCVHWGLSNTPDSS